MAKIKPMALVESMSSKVCMHSNVYFRTNKVTGATFAAKLCNPYDGGNSEDQLAARNRFAAVSAAVRARIAALQPTEKTALLAQFRGQSKVGSFFGYCFKKWNSEYDDSGVLITADDSD